MDSYQTYSPEISEETSELESSELEPKERINSPAVKGQNCSFFDKSIKLGRVTNLYKTNIS